MCAHTRAWVCRSEDSFRELVPVFCWELHTLNSGCQACTPSAFTQRPPTSLICNFRRFPDLPPSLSEYVCGCECGYGCRYMCVFMYRWIHVGWECVHMCTSVCMWRTEHILFLGSCTQYFLYKVPRMGPRVCQLGQDGWPVSPSARPISAWPVLGLETHTTTSCFLHGCWDQNQILTRQTLSYRPNPKRHRFPFPFAKLIFKWINYHTIRILLT